MSFGFSPGDIVLFGKFIAKVVDALKDEGGSQFEYQSAISQCEDVLDLMQEVAQLDLSRVPQSLKVKITERLNSTASIVTDFKVVIARYEKSMGKSSKRNAITSAPRKVQWAFDAAEDLSKFQPRLHVQLQMVQIVLQMGVLKFFGVTSRSDRLLAAPRQNQLLENGQETSHQVPNMWSRGLLDQDQMHALASQITDLVYHRLFTSPSPVLATPGRAFTLPDGEPTTKLLENQPSRMQLENGVSKSNSLALISSTAASQNDDSASTQDGSLVRLPRRQQTGDPPLIDEINEHLQGLNLEELSHAEIHSLDDLALPPSLLDSSKDTPQAPPSRTTDNFSETPNFNDVHSKLRRRFRPRFSTPGIFDPLSTLTMASNILQFVEFAGKLATQSNSIYRDAGRVPMEVEAFSRKVAQYSQILSVVADTIMGTMDDGNMRVQVESLLKETHHAFSRAERILDGYAARVSRNVIVMALSHSRWNHDRTEISLVMDDIEALKLSLVILLQSMQIKAQSRSNASIARKGHETQVGLGKVLGGLSEK